VKNLDDGLLEGVLKIIREPGWTSIAELTFAEAMTEAIIETAALVRRLQGGLEAGANRVERPGDPPPASA
jgi:hypothetical protein